MPIDPPNDQLIAVETTIAHLQHQMEQLHEVILSQQEDIAALRRDLLRAQGRIDQMDAGDDAGDARDERPPHY